MFPYDDAIVLELLEVNENVPIKNKLLWPTRNQFWQYTFPIKASGLLDSGFGFLRSVNWFLLDTFFAGVRVGWTTTLNAPDTNPVHQQIRYFDNPGNTKYVFTFVAYSLEKYGARMVSEYFDFCNRYYEETGWRLNLPTTSYISIQDNNAIFSYARQGAVISLDPVATGYPGWREFLRAYNKFAERFGGVGMFGQTPELTPQQAAAAWGAHTLAEFEAKRREYDPYDRLLNEYFRNLLPVSRQF